MEEKSNRRSHSVSWRDRAEGTVSGVTDVLSFDEHAVILETEQGLLTIKGKNLHIGKLELSDGEVEMEGNIDSILYSGSRPKQSGSLFKRLFR